MIILMKNEIGYSPDEKYIIWIIVSFDNQSGKFFNRHDYIE